MTVIKSKYIYTIDWENVAVKIMLRLRPTAKIKHTKKNYVVMINEKVSTPPKVYVQSTTVYNQPYLALPIPGSRLNTRNPPGTRLHCNCQLLKKKNFHGLNETAKI